MALPYKEEKHGNWQNVSELVDFKIIKNSPSCTVADNWNNTIKKTMIIAAE